MSVTFAKIGADRVMRTDDAAAFGVSNRNAVHILTELGYEVSVEHLVDDLDPADLAARCALYLAVAPDDRELSTFSERDGRFIDCGQPDGYLKRTIGWLGELAESAIRDGVAVCYA